MPRLPLTNQEISELDSRKLSETLDYARLQYERKIRAQLETILPFMNDLLEEWTAVLTTDIRHLGDKHPLVRKRLKMGIRIRDVVSYLAGKEGVWTDKS